METTNKVLNDQLKKALELTAELYNTIVEMDNKLLHPSDKGETCRDIHNIQNRIYTIAYKNHEFLD